MNFWDKLFGKKSAEGSGETTGAKAPVLLSAQGKEILAEVQKLADEGKYKEACNNLIGAASIDKELLRTDLCKLLIEKTKGQESEQDLSKMRQSLYPAYRYKPQ